MTVQILHGDCRELMAAMPAQSVHCGVTSPPYWGLRDYGTAPLSWPAIAYSPLPGLPACVEIPAMESCLGLEPTIEAFIGHMILVFREFRRVLRDDGTCWVNMGDSYAGARSTPGDWQGSINGAQPNHAAIARQKMVASRRRDDEPVPRSDLRIPGLKAKDMVGQPWRLAFALQADGWWLRQDVIWNKPNPMPESTKDRCTKSHEYLFLLAKSERYYFDQDAISEIASEATHARAPGNTRHAAADLYATGDEHHRTKGGLVAYAERQRAKFQKPVAGWATGEGDHSTIAHAQEQEGRQGKLLATPRQQLEGNDSAYAAGKSERLGRGPGWRARKLAEANPEPERRNKRSVWPVPTFSFAEAHFATFPPDLIKDCIKASCPEGGTVMDMFGGAGTTGLVADRLGRNAVLCELNADYIGIGERRLAGDKGHVSRQISLEGAA